jgi:hypothetical protein
MTKAKTGVTPEPVGPQLSHFRLFGPADDDEYYPEDPRSHLEDNGEHYTDFGILAEAIGKYEDVEHSDDGTIQFFRLSSQFRDAAKHLIIPPSCQTIVELAWRPDRSMSQLAETRLS